MTIELGDRVVVELRGKRLDRLGARGFSPTLFQVVEVRGGKIVRMQDYPERDAAHGGRGPQALRRCRPPPSSTSTGRSCAGRPLSRSPARSASAA